MKRNKWPSVALKHLVRFGNGRDHSSVEDVDGQYPVLGSGGPFACASEYLYDGESVLFGRKGTIDKPRYINGRFWTVDTMYFTIIGPNLVPRWLYYWATTIPFSKYATNTALPSMTSGILGSLRLKLPTLLEQQQIADYLDRETAEIDAFLHDQNLLIDLLRERRVAQLAREVAGTDSGLAKNDVPWAPGLKTPYPTVNIRRVAEMRTGHTPNRSKPEYWVETNIPWFTLADVWQIRAGNQFLGETAEMISNLGLANSAADLLPEGTVVLSRTASVGFTGIMPHPMATSQDYWNWVCGPNILSEYLWLQFRAMRPEFDRIKSGSTHKTIYKADAAAITLVLPPLEDQHAIVQRLTAIDEELAAAEKDVLASVQLAQERRSALISAAVTGQIDVTAQDVPAAEQLQNELEVPL